MVDGKCWQCKFYKSSRRDQGECRRMPPPWRFVDSGDWCGEFCPTQRAPDLKPACPICKDTGSVEYPCPNCRPSKTASSG